MTPDVVRSIRSALHLTRRALAARLGVSYGAIASWEAPEGRADHRAPSGPALALLWQIRGEAEAAERRRAAEPAPGPAPKRPRGRPRKRPPDPL